MISDLDLQASIIRREENLRDFDERARFALADGDYSGAATWCHRAHQEKLVLGALRYTLTGEHGLQSQ